MFETTHTPSSKLIIALIIVVVVAAIMGALYFNFSKFQEETETVRTGMPVYAAHGEVTAGFPKELILDDAARVQESYTISYNDRLKQYTVSFSSSKNAAVLLSEYRNYLQNDGWEIINETNLPNIKGVYGRKEFSSVNVVIRANALSSAVDITYVLETPPQVSVPDAFPSELILDPNVEIIVGKNGVIEDGHRVYSVAFISQTSVNDLMTRYNAYLREQGWDITDEASRRIVAHKDGMVVLVMHTPLEEGVRTLINYAEPQ